MRTNHSITIQTFDYCRMAANVELQSNNQPLSIPADVTGPRQRVLPHTGLPLRTDLRPRIPQLRTWLLGTDDER